jgi:hypothetical protein
MKISILILPLITCLYTQEKVNLNEVRALYFKSADDRSAAEKLSALLSSADSTANPLIVCYKGASEMMKAKYYINPLKKYAAFKNGRVLIETAIRRDPVNVEEHFLRFTIQSNLPGFLGYNENIAADKKTLINKMPSVDDIELKKLMINYLEENKYFTPVDIKQLKQ